MTLWRVRATVDDRPGFLSVLTASLALRSINIMAVQVHTTAEGAVDDFLVDAPDDLDEDDLLAAIEKGRGREAWVARTDARDLVDPPTQLAGLAARLVSDPGSLGSALSTMLGGCLVQHEQTDSVTGHGPNSMRLVDPAGGTIVLTRLAPSFTPAEFARAQALVELARVAITRQRSDSSYLLPDGTEFTLRLARLSDDLAAVAQMHSRCSPESLFRRYLVGTKGPSESQLARLLSPAKGAALVAETMPGRGGSQVVAVGNLVGEGEVAEAAFLVEDAWQHKGLGTALLRQLVAIAKPLGFRCLEVHTHADNDAMIRTVRRLRPEATFDFDGGLASATIAVDGFAPALT